MVRRLLAAPVRALGLVLVQVEGGQRVGHGPAVHQGFLAENRRSFSSSGGRFNIFLVSSTTCGGGSCGGFKVGLPDENLSVAGAGGKFKTGLQLIGIALMLIQFTYRDPLWGLSYDTQAIGLTLLWISLVFSLTSAISYTSKYLRGLDRAG